MDAQAGVGYCAGNRDSAKFPHLNPLQALLGCFQLFGGLLEAFFQQSLSDKFAIEVSHIFLFTQTILDFDGSRLYVLRVDRTLQGGLVVIWLGYRPLQGLQHLIAVPSINAVVPHQSISVSCHVQGCSAHSCIARVGRVRC